MSNSVSEHGFHIHDAEHTRGTNRYTFRYPEVWYSAMNAQDLVFGLRSIILKEFPSYIDFGAFQIANAVWGEAMDDVFVPNTTNKIAYDRPSLNGLTVYPDRMPLTFAYELNEGVKMSDICKDLTNQVNNDITQYSENYDSLDATWDEAHSDADLEDFQIKSGCVSFTFSTDRVFRMATSDSIRFMVSAGAKSFTVTDVESNKLNTVHDPIQVTPDVNEETKVTTDVIYECDCFSKEFESLLSLKFEDDLTLNKILSGLAGLQSNYTIGQAQADCDKYGIVFENVSVAYTPIESKYETNDDGNYDMTKAKTSISYSIDIFFTCLNVSQVWSRKDVLIRSSIAEMDTRNYLGYSTMQGSSPVCIYASPKMYPIESQSYKFWIDLYDSLNNDLVELPDNVVLIIEAALYLNPKVPFNRY